MPSPTTAQIGKAGELLVQIRLLLLGIDSAAMSTDAGIDLVAYSSLSRRAITIQVKTNLKPKPGGGKGKLALDWWVPEKSPAELQAMVDLSESRVWLFTTAELASFAQQTSSGRHHLYMVTDPTYVQRKTIRPTRPDEFSSFALEHRASELLEA